VELLASGAISINVKCCCVVRLWWFAFGSLYVTYLRAWSVIHPFFLAKTIEIKPRTRWYHGRTMVPIPPASCLEQGPLRIVGGSPLLWMCGHPSALDWLGKTWWTPPDVNSSLELICKMTICPWCSVLGGTFDSDGLVEKATITLGFVGSLAGDSSRQRRDAWIGLVRGLHGHCFGLLVFLVWTGLAACWRGIGTMGMPMAPVV